MLLLALDKMSSAILSSEIQVLKNCDLATSILQPEIN